MKYILLILCCFQSVFAQTKTDEGYVIYQVSLTEAYYFSEEYKTKYPDAYSEGLEINSLIDSIKLGVVFSKNLSNSFRLKKVETGANNYHSALYKIYGVTDYYYNSKTNKGEMFLEYWLKPLVITVDLKDKWSIDFNKTKIIDGYKCYNAKYVGEPIWWKTQGNEINAWFTTEIPLPYGPLHYNGLPGLIIELNVDNVRYTATKIAFNDKYKSKIRSLDVSKKEVLTELEFIKTRADIKRKAKRIMIGG